MNGDHISLVSVTKRYGNTFAARDVSFSVKKGEILSLLGPSGCGKTTVLKIVAGLVRPDSGSVLLSGRDITDLPPERRGFGMVFQNYALWPHMTVFDNVAFGLRMRRYSDAEIRKRVKEALELVRINGLENRYPSQLSGGQQQRVAIARAIAPNPEAILLDEPLSNLDAKLREELRHELRAIIKSIGITAIYVTHDQLEALSLSDRIAVMKDGRILQIGTPREVYEEPVDEFVATFLGESVPAKGSVKAVNGSKAVVELDDGMEVEGRAVHAVRPGDRALVIFRPESIAMSSNGRERCRVHRKNYLGERIEYRVLCGGLELKMRSEAEREVGEDIFVSFNSDKIIVMRGN